MSVEVVVPYGGSCLYRERAWAWVASRYAERHPAWRVTRAAAQPGPWSKGKVTAAAVEASSADTIVLADADVWTDGLGAAVEQVEAGAPWSVPHYLVHRLTAAATENWLSGRPDMTCEQPPYPGIIGGGITAAPREVLRAIPLDSRFVGWGQEDESIGFALDCLLGPPWRGTADLIHLWHPPQERATRVWGSHEGWVLRRRYAKARHDPVVMRRLIEEARHDVDAAPQQDGHDHAPLSVG